MRTRALPGILITVALAAPTGCVAWQSGDVRTLPDPLFGPEHRAAGARKPVPLVLSVSYDATGVDMDRGARTKRVDLLLSRAHDVFDDGDQFDLKDAQEGHDYALAVDVMDEAWPNTALAVVSGLTLTVIPAVSWDTFTITATLRSPDGSQLGHRQIRQEETMLVQLFTIFGMPFAAPTNVDQKLWIGVFRDLALWTRDTIARKVDVLPAASSAQPPSVHAD